MSSHVINNSLPGICNKRLLTARTFSKQESWVLFSVEKLWTADFWNETDAYSAFIVLQSPNKTWVWIHLSVQQNCVQPATNWFLIKCALKCQNYSAFLMFHRLRLQGGTKCAFYLQSRYCNCHSQSSIPCRHFYHGRPRLVQNKSSGSQAPAELANQDLIHQWWSQTQDWSSLCTH